MSVGERMKDVIIVCDDLFGLEVYSILEEINKTYTSKGQEALYNISGYISFSECPFGNVKHSIKRLGGIDDRSPSNGESYVMAVTSPSMKKRIVDIMEPKGCRFETVIAPWTRRKAEEVGEGTLLAAFSVKSGLKLGRYVTAVESMLISRPIGDFSTIMRFANITGNVGTGSYIGNHAYSHLDKSIGDNCYVADGSIIVKNVKDGTCVAGMPAKKIKAEDTRCKV